MKRIKISNPRTGDVRIDRAFADLNRALEAIYNELERKPNRVTRFDLSNVTSDRKLDADSTSTAELADVLGTLINDLK